MLRSQCAIALLLVSVAIVPAGSPVLANGGPTCSISPSRVQATIDPEFFDAGDPPDVALEQVQAMFHPMAFDFDTTSPGLLWARFTLTLRGKTYADTEGWQSPMVFPVDSPYPSAFGWAAAFYGSWAYIWPHVPELASDLPDFGSYVDAFMDPRSYPMTYEVTYSADNSGPPMCSLVFEFDVRAGGGGWDIDLGHYLGGSGEDQGALPNTR